MNAVLLRFFIHGSSSHRVNCPTIRLAGSPVCRAGSLCVQFLPGPFPDPSDPGVVIGNVLSGQPAGNLVGTDAQETAPLDGLVAAMLIQALDRQSLAIEDPKLRDTQGGVDARSVRLRN